MGFKLKNKNVPSALKQTRVDSSDIKNYIKKRRETGRFENQLGDGQMEAGFRNLDNVRKVSREQMVEEGYDGASAWQMPGNVPRGMYGPEDNIYFAEPTVLQRLTSGSGEGTDTHERGHVFDIGTLKTTEYGNVLPKTNIHKAIENIPVKGGYETSDYMPSAEVFAELLKFKLQNDIDPKKVYDKKDLPELRKKLSKEKDYGIFNINDMYEDEGLIRLMNEVVDVDNKKDDKTRLS